MDKRRILVVEDNPVEQQLVSLLAARMGLAAEVVDNGYKALERLSSSEAGYAAVLMNYSLPVMDGPEVAQRIRAMDAPANRLPIIAVTARVREDSWNECSAAGMDDYLGKPYSLDQFQATVQRWVGEEGSA